MALGDGVPRAALGQGNPHLGKYSNAIIVRLLADWKGGRKSVFWQLRRGQEWQKFIKVFREVKAALMQIGRWAGTGI